MNPIDEYKSLYPLRPFGRIPNSWEYELKTPAHHFTYLIVEVNAGRQLLWSAARDGFNSTLAQDMVGLVRQFEGLDAPLTPPLVLLPNLRSQGVGFDTVAVIDFRSTTKAPRESESLWKSLLVFFPAYHCEFNAKDSPAIIRAVRRDLISTIDWEREPSPRVWMRYSNEKTKAGSIGKAFGLADVGTVKREIPLLPNDVKSFIEVRNYLDQQARITYQGDGYLVTSDRLPSGQRIDSSEIFSWADTFFLKGLPESSREV